MRRILEDLHEDSWLWITVVPDSQVRVSIARINCASACKNTAAVSYTVYV
jgi:hypothetical protein